MTRARKRCGPDPDARRAISALCTEATPRPRSHDELCASPRSVEFTRGCGSMVQDAFAPPAYRARFSSHVRWVAGLSLSTWAEWSRVAIRWCGRGSPRRHYPNVPSPLRRGVPRGCVFRIYTASMTFTLRIEARTSTPTRATSSPRPSPSSRPSTPPTAPACATNSLRSPAS